MADTGMAFKSVPELPRPLVPYKFISEDWCLLLPLISTSVWSGPKPLNVAGSTWSAPSAPDCLEALKEGITCWSSWLISNCPELFVAFSMSTISIAAGVSIDVLFVFLEPTTCTSSKNSPCS